MRRLAVPLVFLAALSLGGCAASPARPMLASGPAPTGPPKLVVAISVDQLSADLFAQ